MAEIKSLDQLENYFITDRFNDQAFGSWIYACANEEEDTFNITYNDTEVNFFKFLINNNDVDTLYNLLTILVNKDPKTLKYSINTDKFNNL